MAINFLQNVDLNKGEIQNVALQNAGTNPGTPATGQIYFNTGDNTLRVYNGTSWDSYSTTTGDITAVTAGDGLTGGGTSGGVTLNVVGGDGITANANDVAITPAQTTITSVLNTSLTVGRDADNQIKFATDNQIIFRVSGTDGVVFKASGEIEATSLDISGDVDVDGTLEADAITLNGTALGALATLNTVDTAQIANDSIDSTKIEDYAISEEHLDVTAITGFADIGAALEDEDTFLVHDDSAGALKEATMDRLQTYMQSNLAFTTNTDVDVSNANLLTRLAALESSGGAADENIVIGADSGDTIVITGNLQVSGTTTTVNSTVVDIADNNITLSSGNATSAPIDGAGITIEGGTGDDVGLKWNAAGNRFDLFKGVSFANLQALDTKVNTLSMGGTLVTSTAAELNTLDGYLGSVTEFNYLKDLYDTGVTSTEFDYLDGVTSNIQTQLNGKAASGYAADVGGGTSVTINHGLGTRDVVVQLYDNSTYDTVYADTIRLDANNVRFLFRTAPAAAAYRCVITRI
jgi:hypothetical protein